MTAHHLTAQKRMAMELMKVGQRGVWLDPNAKAEVAAAKTRAAIRALIEKGVIRRAFPRHRQTFLIPPQYLSRFRQRMLYEPKFRKTSLKLVRPTSGKRYFKPRYWKRKKLLFDEPPKRTADGDEINVAQRHD
jgi:ribosomal protein L19E